MLRSKVTFVKRFLLLLVVLIFSFFLLPGNALAADPIRITGFDYPRTLNSLNSSQVNYLKSQLLNSSNFGDGGIVQCGVSFLPFMADVAPGSLVQNGQRMADVFFGGLMNTLSTGEGNLRADEAQELKKFIEAGGIVYIAENGFPGYTSDYNRLFEAMGIGDRFLDEVDQTHFVGESYFPAETPITNGLFGRVGNLTHGEFRVLSVSSLLPVAQGFGSGNGGGGIGTFSLVQNSNANYILAEKEFGLGYLSVTGNPIYLFDNDGDITKYFLNLFAHACGIPNEGGGGVLDVPLLKQTDSRWAGQVYNNYQSAETNQTIGKWGCALTSAAMILNYYNHSVTPGELDLWLKQNNGYSPSHGIKFPLVALYATQRKDESQNRPGLEYTSLSYSSNELQSEILSNPGKPAIVEVQHPTSPSGSHYVVATGIQGDDFMINDPGQTNKTRLLEFSQPRSLRSFEPSFTDPSYILIYLDANMTVKVVDPSGNEVPNSYYIEEPLGDGEVEGVSGLPLGVIAIPKPLLGHYTIQIGDGNGSYNIDSTLISPEGTVSVNSFIGMLSEEQTDDLIVDVGLNSSVEQVITIDSTIADLDAAFKEGYINNEKVYRILRSNLVFARGFYQHDRTFLYEIFLKLALQGIRKSTPRYISVEASDVLQRNIAHLINS